LLKLGPFEAAVSRGAGNPALFVIRRDGDRPGILGYQVALEQLKSALLERGSRIPTSPEMEISTAPSTT
jgi:hypothetical protein